MIKNKKENLSDRPLTINFSKDVFKMLAFVRFETEKSYKEIISGLIEELYKSMKEAE